MEKIRHLDDFKTQRKITKLTPMVTFTATATVRPTDSDWAQQSHYYDANQSKQGWLVWIYYPENYKGPRETAEGSADADFLINGFMLIPSDGATVTEFSQTEGACYDAEKPCHIGTPGDFDNSTTYSVQIFLTTTQDQASIQIIWDRKAGNWSDGSPPPDMTYNLMSSKNTMLYTDPMFDPDHTQQYGPLNNGQWTSVHCPLSGIIQFFCRRELRFPT